MAGFDPSKYGSKKSKIYGSSAADTRVDSGTETGFDPSRYGDSKSKLYSPGSMVITPEPVETQQKKRERQVVSPYGTFLGGFSFAGDRQKTAKELADEKAQQEAYLQEYRRLAGLDLDDYRTEVERAGKKAQESKQPYNIHAFGAYNPQKTEAERNYAAMKADLNKAESIQYDSKGREALDNLTEDQTAALEVLTDTTGVPAAAAHVDAARKQAAREALLASGFSEDELSQLVNYYRNIPKREKNAERYAKVQEMARNEGEKSPIGGTLLSVPANLLSGVGAIDAALRKLADPNTPTDYNAPAMLPYAYASGVRGEVTKNLQYDHGDAAAFAYGVGTSMLDSAATAALAALGVPPAAASATLGGAAATDAMVAAKDRGLDDSHAIVTGVAAGVMESFFEKVSLESLIHMKLPTGTAKQKLAGMLKNAAIQGGIEGSEEMFTDLANLWWDKVINGGMADVNQRIAVYMAGGMSYQEAQQKVVGETIKDIALDFGAGALAGGIMGGGNMAVQTAAQGRYQDAMQQIRQQSGVTGAYQASEDGRTTYHDTDAQIRSVVKDGKVQLESGETVDPKDVRFKDQQTADLYEGAINTAENAGAAQVFVDSYTGGDVSRYLLGMRQAYEAGRAGIPVEEMTRGTFADDLSEVQRSAAYEQGRLTTEAEFPTMGDMGLGESGSAAWAKAEKINTTLSKGKVQAGFTALYQAGLRRESAVNVKSTAASELPQSVQTAAYEAGLSDAAASLAREKAGLDFVSSAGSESGLVDNEYSRKMAKEQAGTAALLNTLGKNLGVRIEMVDTISGGKANGVYIGGKNLIQIAADADNAFGFVAAHEVTHRMQELAPEEYRAYRDHAMSYRARESGEEGAAAYVERYRAMAEEAGVKLTQEEAMDEIAADFTRDMMENGNLFEDFAKENRSAAKKLLDALKAFIAKVKSLFRSKTAQDRAAQDAYGKSMAELEQCAALWQKAYDAAGKQAQKAKTAAREGDGEGRYQIKNIDGRLMTVIDTQNDTRDFKAAEAYLKTLVNTDHPFSTILMDAQPVYVGKDLPGEYRSSEYSKKLRKAMREVKMQAATNLDEMLLLAENGEWRENVKPKHVKDAMNGWYRYDTEFAVPILDAKKTVDHYTVYGGTLLIRNDADGKSYLYDLLDIEKKKVISAASFSAETHSEVFAPKPSTDSISASGEKVNGKFSLKAYSDVEKKQHVKDAKAFFGRTYKWAETGYITTDGARLDFSGKHEGGPGGYRTVDHRDIRDALGDDYGGDDYSGAMVQFMGEGNIRISPESGGINLSVMPTKAQMDTLSDFISKERGEVVLDLDDTNGVTLSSTEYPRGTHSSKVLNDIKAFFETGAVPQVSELGRFRYQLKNFSEQAVSTALYDALSEKATRQNQLIPVSVMPRYISEKLGIGGDIYIQRDHAYENMVSKEQAIQDGRPTQRKGENVHFHDLGVEKMTRAIMSINEPTMTISTKTKDGNPAVIMMLPEYGNNDAPLYAVLSFYSRKTISPENRETRPHVVLTIAERNFFEEGGRYGWADVIKRAINEGTVIDFNKKERSSLSEVAQSVGLGDITDASLKKNLAQFQKEVKQFRESNNIRYQLKSATELEQEVRELKKERRALENRNKVLTERVAKWRGETALDVLSDMVQHQRSAAQALQATRILKQLSPETQLYQAQRSIANLQTQLNEEYGDDKAPKLKIDQTLAEQFMKAADQAERDAVLANIYRDIGKQMPSRFKDKWNAWRYLAMLGNVRTHVRNVVGNAGFVPVVAAKNVVATGIEKAVYRLSGGKMERSKEFVTGKGGKALLQAAAQDYAKVADVAMGGGKYSDFANANKTLETQHFIGQITKRANRPPVTTYSGIAVLTLIQLFALQTQPHGRIAVDAFCRHKADNTAAVSANMGYLQPHAPLRSPCGFFASRLCFRRGHAELCLHIERILRGERQHSRLGDAQRNGAAQCPQAAFQPIHRKAVVTGRLSRQRNDRQCRVGGTDLTGAAKGQPIPVKVQDRSVVHARGSGHLQCAAQFLGIAQHRKCVLCPRNETVCVHIAAVHEPCGKLKTLFHKDELPVSHANGKCVLFLAELGQLFQIGSRDKKRLVTGTLLISLCGNNADAIAANGAQAIRSQAEVYAAQQGHIAVVRVCGKCRTAYHGRNTAELHHAFRSSDVHAWETFAAGCWYLIVRMVTG